MKSDNTTQNSTYIFAAVSLMAIMALSLFITGCSSGGNTDVVKEYPSDMTIKFQTFGGFRAMDNAATDIVINSTKTTYTTYSYEGNITTHYVIDTEKILYAALVKAIIDNDYVNFKDKYVLAENELVTDIGDADLTIINGGKSKTINFEKYLDNGYPLPVKNVLGRINAIEERIYLYQDNQYVNVSYQPMQCTTASWDEWLANSSIRFIRAPTEAEIITMYYGREGMNVSIRDIVQMNSTGMVCEACGVCPKEYRIQAEVKYKDFQYIVDDGWTKVQNISI